MYTVTINFIYNSTYYITLSIPAQGAAQIPAHFLTVSNLFDPSKTSTYWSATVGATTSTLYPIVFGANTVMSPTGSTWLSVQNIPSIYSGTAAVADTAASMGVIITDYVSSSTIALTLWNDNVTPDLVTTGSFNGFYQLGVRN